MPARAGACRRAGRTGRSGSAGGRRSRSSVRPKCSTWAATRLLAQRRRSSARLASLIRSWFGVGPAVVADGDGLAAPDQLGPAPAEVRRQRRRVRSEGVPSAVPSQPSIGRIAKRLPIGRPSTAIRPGERGVGAVVDARRRTGGRRRSARACSRKVVGGLERGDPADRPSVQSSVDDAEPLERCRGGRRGPTRAASGCPGGSGRGAIQPRSLRNIAAECL